MRHYREVFGPSYVHTIEVSKRGLEFIAITLSEGGPAVVQRNKFRISRGALVELSEDQENLQSYVPIILTAHCIERFLQSSRSGLATVADVMHQLWKASQPHFILGFDGARDIYPVWSASGRFAFATKEYLVLGDIPEYQDMICKTVIRADRLEASKAYLWERARQTQSGLLIQQSN